MILNKKSLWKIHDRWIPNILISSTNKQTNFFHFAPSKNQDLMGIRNFKKAYLKRKAF